MKSRIETRYRFRNGSGDYLCLLVMEADQCVLGFQPDSRNALSVRSFETACLIQKLTELAGAPVIAEPYSFISKK